MLGACGEAYAYITPESFKTAARDLTLSPAATILEGPDIKSASTASRVLGAPKVVSLCVTSLYPVIEPVESLKYTLPYPPALVLKVTDPWIFFI